MSNTLQLLGILTENENTNISKIARKALSYTDALQAGEINETEFRDLMHGLESTKLIQIEATDLAAKQMLASALNSAIALGSAAVRK